MRMAAVQLVSGTSVEANLEAAARLIGEAAGQGARLVVLPENFALMPSQESDRLAVAEREHAGPIQDFLARTARTHRVWLVGGTIPLAARAPGKVRAACLLYDDQGRQIARYDKMHLFDVTLPNGEQYCESRHIEAGEAPVVADTPFGRLGLAVCYDLRFPELFRRLLDLGAELFAVPSAFTAVTGRAHWEVLARSRAIENLAYLVAAAQGGRHESGRETYGDTMIVNPWGEVLGRRARGAGVVAADLDREMLVRVRGSLPSIQHRRITA
jgi:nitrilase